MVDANNAYTEVCNLVMLQAMTLEERLACILKIDGGKKTFKGFLQGIDENGYILLKTEDHVMNFDFSKIEKANIDPDWAIKNNQIK